MEIVGFDYAAHNEAVRKLSRDFEQGCNERCKMQLSMNPRMILLDPSKNTERIGFEQYFSDPDVMAGIQCRFIEYRDTELFYDHIMGWEEAEIALSADFQNVLEPEWFGCPPYFPDGGEPSARHWLEDDGKAAYLDGGMIDPFSGLYGRALEYYDYFSGLKQNGFTYKGKPISRVAMPGMGTDGVFTTACSIRGSGNICVDLYCDYGFAMEFLDYLNENIIARIKAFRRHFGLPEKTPSFGFADDCIALLSVEDYERFILPFHKRMVAELSTGESPNGTHLCGDATRHFPTMVRELDMNSFDTGFPVRHGELVRELGPEITVSGGVHVDILLNGTRQQVCDETRRILEEVKPHTRKFIMKEANNLSPCTPPENILAMYDTVKKYGVFEG